MAARRGGTVPWSETYDVPSRIAGIRDLIRFRRDQAQADLKSSGYDSRTWRNLLTAPDESADQNTARDLAALFDLQTLLKDGDAEGAAWVAYEMGRRHTADPARWRASASASKGGETGKRRKQAGLLAAAALARKAHGRKPSAPMLWNWIVARAKSPDGLVADGFTITYDKRHDTIRQIRAGHKSLPITRETFRTRYAKAKKKS